MAKKVKSQAKRKEHTYLKEQTHKFLAKVPEEHVFWCCSGNVFRNMEELADGLAAMSDDVFAHHVNSEKNDFCNWVRDVIEDEKLSNDLARATSRLQASEYVVARINLLTRNSSGNAAGRQQRTK